MHLWAEEGALTMTDYGNYAESIATNGDNITPDIAKCIALTYCARPKIDD